MSNELLVKYERMLNEIQSKNLRERMRVFLSNPELTEAKLDNMVADYVARLENNYVRRPNDEYVMFIEAFKRKGTILPLMSDEEILNLARESKRQTYLK